MNEIKSKLTNYLIITILNNMTNNNTSSIGLHSNVTSFLASLSIKILMIARIRLIIGFIS